MAVYTPISKTDAYHLLEQYDRPIAPIKDAPIELTPISAGMENSNYWLKHTSFEGVLTLFEQVDHQAVGQYVRLAQHLAQQGIAAPAPLVDQQGHWLHTLADKPTILCHRLKGRSIEQVTSDHAFAIGRELAQAHIASQTLNQPIADQRNLNWWLETANDLQLLLAESQDWQLLTKSLTEQQTARQQWLELPCGWIHGDCFRDNVLFIESTAEVGAILDWYNACDGPWLYDLAIVYQDWCVDDAGKYDSGLSNALLHGYGEVRPLEVNEQQAWPLVCRAAALRFWLSRLIAEQAARARGDTLPLSKQPIAYRHKLAAAWQLIPLN